MTYQVLARKLRPADFSALVGQDHVVQALSHALDNDRLHHAYLFTGTRGVGKTTIARILARCLNCEKGVSSTPCGECDTCQAISQGRFVDLIEMDGASQNKVENVHDLQDGAQYMPNSGRFKVYLIDEVHMLSKSAFNALLKILEEPPAHVKFLLATTEVNKLPITILSRCLQFQLKNMTVDRISSYLAQALETEGVPFETGALRIIGTAAAGSMRDALSVTDQAISFGAGKLEESQVARMLGVTGRDEISALLQALASTDASSVLACSKELSERGVDFASVLADMLRAFHDIAVAQVVPVDTVVPTGDAKASPEESEEPEEKASRATDLVADSLGAAFANRFAPDVVQLFYQIALRSHRDLAMSPDPQIGFEMALLRMLAFAPDDIAQSVPSLVTSTAGGSDSSGSVPPGSVPPDSAAPADGSPAATSSSIASSSTASAAPERGAVSHEAAKVAPQRVTALINSKNNPPSPVVLPAAPDAFWYELQNQLGAQGIIAMIMRNSVMLKRETLGAAIGPDNSEEHWHLQLDPAHDGMLSDRHPKQIASLVSDATDSKVGITLTVGAPAWETPGAQLARERRERQAEAVQTMRDSAMVQSLLSTFGATLDEASIRPIEPETNRNKDESS